MINMTHTENFERLWDNFIVKLKGKLLNVSMQKELTFSYVKLILDNEIYAWDSDYDEEGRWLKQYMNENPREGQLIKEILLDDMSFTEIEPPKKADSLTYIVPVVGAAAGLGLSSIFNANLIVKAISTVAPAAILFPTTKTVLNYFSSYNSQTLIDNYIGQLDKYKNSIISIIQQ